MSKAAKILEDREYRKWLSRIENLEQDRKFCRHGMEHLMAVARICYILCLEEDIEKKILLAYPALTSIELKEMVYAAALTHDLGRAITYETGGDHAFESKKLAVPILKTLGFTPEQMEIILDAVREHRERVAGMSILGDVLYRADKLSRPCETCTSQSDCDKIQEMQRIKQKSFY